MKNWAAHNLPFLALIAADTPINRPAATRLAEQLIVAAVTAWLTLYASESKNAAAIETLTRKLDTMAADRRTADAHEAEAIAELRLALAIHIETSKPK